MNPKIQELIDDCDTYIDPNNKIAKREIEILCEEVVIECAAICEEHPAMSGRSLADMILRRFNIQL